MLKLLFNLVTLKLLAFIFLYQERSVAGLDEQKLSLHPVHPAYPPRRQSAQTQPTQRIALHYAQTRYETVTHYAATVFWYMRYPTIVALDDPQIGSINCDVDGIHIGFNSQDYKVEAQQWKLPMVIVLDGPAGNCGSDRPGQERYHPFYAEAQLLNRADNSTTLTLRGFRSRWDLVAYDHQVQLERLPAKSSESTQTSSLRRRDLSDPLTWSFSPSLNFNRTQKASSTQEVPINIATWEDGSLDLKCKNCFMESDFQLNIYSGSRIINAGIKAITKLIRSLYQAEQMLLSLAQSAKRTLSSHFSQLSHDLAEAMSGFYNHINDLALSTKPDQKADLQKRLGDMTSLAQQSSRQLLIVAERELGASIISLPFAPREHFLVIRILKKIIQITSGELELSIQDGVQLIKKELALPVCTESEELNFALTREICRPRRKRTSARLTGRLRANLDIELEFTGKGEITNGDVNIFSMNLAGLEISGILSIGPQARLLSHTGLVFQSSATLSFGVDLEWSNIDASMDGKEPKNIRAYSTTPKLQFNQHPTQFEINPQQLSLEQHFKPQVTFGIDLILGSQSLHAGIGADIAMINSLQLPKLPPKPSDYCWDGLQYNLNVTARLEAVTSLPTVAGVLLSKILPKLSKTVGLGKHAYPLLEAPQVNLMKHCFQVPSNFLTHLDRFSKKLTNKFQPGKISNGGPKG